MEPFYRTIIGVARTVFAGQGLNSPSPASSTSPRPGGAVIAINHTGYMDFTYAGLPARAVKRYIPLHGEERVFVNKVSGPMMRAMKHIPGTGAAGADSYRAAVQALRDGELVGVFPEATISRSFELKEFKSGAARMALESGTPIVPMVIWGSQRVWTKGFPKRLGRTNTPISIAVGEPIAPFEPASEMTALLHSRMEELLRGVQANYEHPAGEYWVPARLGGGAPTLEEANRMDAEEPRPRLRPAAPRSPAGRRSAAGPVS
ncbi:1-acyl-sn-glycerol-3-phosphate acyltransferase [Rhodococcus hoagii]|nr:1-acyl-sn-glycerol-3-phosphate acyltransferase [Prescottella equi]